jgi:hypothetical protein
MRAIECKSVAKREQTELAVSAGACTEVLLSISVVMSISVASVLSIVVLVVVSVFVLRGVSILSDVISVCSPNFS